MKNFTSELLTKPQKYGAMCFAGRLLTEVPNAIKTQLPQKSCAIDFTSKTSRMLAPTQADSVLCCSDLALPNSPAYDTTVLKNSFSASIRRFLAVMLLLLAVFSGPLTAQQHTVEIGMYLIDIARLDVKESEFFADFYIWYKAEPAAAWTPANIEFMNGTVESATEPQLATDTVGRSVWTQRIKGRFRGRFRLQAYPFDSQTLPISIEDSEYQTDKIVFQPDSASSQNFSKWIEPELNVPDWQMAGATCTVDVHEYQTDFGLGNQKTSHYSRLTFKLDLKRLFMPHLIKFILTLIIIAGMAYMVFYINANEFEAQCGICVTALLSAVALHMAQADALPAVGYMLMSDKIFILFYVVIFSALVQTVVNNSYAKRRRFDMAIYLDKLFRVWYVVVLVVGNILVFLLS